MVAVVGGVMNSISKYTSQGEHWHAFFNYIGSEITRCGGRNFRGDSRGWWCELPRIAAAQGGGFTNIEGGIFLSSLSELNLIYLSKKQHDQIYGK